MYDTTYLSVDVSYVLITIFIITIFIVQYLSYKVVGEMNKNSRARDAQIFLEKKHAKYHDHRHRASITHHEESTGVHLSLDSGYNR